MSIDLDITGTLDERPSLADERIRTAIGRLCRGN
jgi:hypothetical protein